MASVRKPEDIGILRRELGASDPPYSDRRGPTSAPVSSRSGGWLPRSAVEGPRRILVVDDTVAIHDDFRKVLCPLPADPGLGNLENALFGSGGAPSSVRDPSLEYLVDTATQGQAGFEMVVRARERGRPYALAFVDMKMPPGWDGVETIKHMIDKDPDLEVVICSAYSDYSWHDVIRRLNRTGLRLLKKPFDSKDVLDLAWSLTSRWLRKARTKIS